MEEFDKIKFIADFENSAEFKEYESKIYRKLKLPDIRFEKSVYSGDLIFPKVVLKEFKLLRKYILAFARNSNWHKFYDKIREI